VWHLKHWLCCNYLQVVTVVSYLDKESFTTALAMNKKDSASSIQNSCNAVEPYCDGNHADDRHVFSSFDDKFLDVGGATETSETNERTFYGLKSTCNQTGSAKIADIELKIAQTNPVTNDDELLDTLSREAIPANLTPFVSPENNNASSIKCEAIGEEQNLPRTENIKVDGQDTSRPVLTRGRSGSADMVDSGKPPESNQGASVSLVPGIRGRRTVKSKKATQRMRPKSHISMKTASGSQPLLDLRHILKKHEKKSESYKDSAFRVDFYGSLSSIPFLHPDKEKKKRRKAEQNQTNKANPLASKKSESKALGKNFENSKITVDSGDAGTTAVTTSFVHDGNAELWKRMSIQDCNFMEEVSNRPNDMLPLTNNPSPVKNAKTTSLQPKDLECSLPDVGGEVSNLHPGFGKFSPLMGERRSISAGRLFLDAKNIPAETKRMEGKTEDAEPHDTEPEGESVYHRDILHFNEHFSDKLAMESALLQSQDESTDGLKTGLSERTTLRITFPDGCTVSGTFRPNEQLQRVINDLRRDLLKGDMALPKIELYAFTQEDEEKTLLDPQAKLNELGLVPSGVVYVRWKTPMAATTSPGWYLRTYN
jgi:hypothetical protein